MTLPVAAVVGFQNSVYGRRTIIMRALLLCLSASAGSCLPGFFAGCLPALPFGRGSAGPTRCLVRPLRSKALAEGRETTYVQGEGGDWRIEEDWALLDEAPSFTVGNGASTVTFWSALAAASTVLCQRTPVELEQRMLELAVAKDLPQDSYGSEPSVISSWERMADGRFTGSVDGRAVWLTVESEGRLASDPRTGPGYIVSLGGRIYELGASSDGNLDISSGRQPAAMEVTPFDPMNILRSMLGFVAGSVPVVAVALLSGGVGLYVGLSNVQPQVINVNVTKAVTTAVPKAPSTVPQPEKVQLLLSEQIARQQLQVDRDRAEIASAEAKLQSDLDQESIRSKVAAEEARLQASRERQLTVDKDRVSALERRLRAEAGSSKDRLTKLNLKMRADQEQLAELQRIEQERGAGAAAVRLSVMALDSPEGVTLTKESPPAKAGVSRQ